jgi:hypothetical protein
MRGAVSHRDGKARLPKQSAAGLFLCVRGRYFSTHATGDTQCGTDGGQDGDQCLNDDFPDVLLVVFHTCDSVV